MYIFTIKQTLYLYATLNRDLREFDLHGHRSDPSIRGITVVYFTDHVNLSAL